jgi:apolipoprotein N-acyltransferase
MYKLSQFVKRTPGWSVFILGAGASLSFAPFYFFPAGILGFSVFLYLLERPPFTDRPFFYGGLFGFGYFTGGLYWIANAFNMVGLWYLVPIGALGLPAFFALLYSAPVVGLAKCAPSGIARCVFFTVLWSVAEYARGHLFTGFPWSLNGYTWPLEILQLTSVIGIYGLSFLTTLLFTSFASHSRIFISSCCGLFMGVYGWGHYRLSQFPTERTGVNMRLVQPSIPQQLKWLAEHFEANFDKQLGLSALEGERPLKAVIWPEASVATFVTDYPVLMGSIAAVAPARGYVIVGGPRHGSTGQIYTSTLIVDPEGQIVASYDKSHLVPFGEYFPFRSLFPLIGKVTAGEQDYTAGQGVQTVTLNGLPPFSPLICYEAIFPGKVAPEPRSAWMLNQTNDAWYGKSPGPFQHLQIARTRSIEEGIPLVRAANNGISAVVDAVGRLTEKLGLNEIGFIDFDLPKTLQAPTFYARYRDLPFLILLICGTILVLVNLKGGRRTRRDRRTHHDKN